MKPSEVLKIVRSCWLHLPTMKSREAECMLLAISKQEGDMQYLKQLGNGPARSLWQFEKGGIKGVLAHKASKPHAERVCGVLGVPATIDAVYAAMGTQEGQTLACCFARLLLYTLPQALPHMGDVEESWGQYIAAWRPGKPHHDRWVKTSYPLALSTLAGEEY